MELILWRHAEAADPDGGDDDARPLTKKGRRQAERMAAWLEPRMAGASWRILVSPALRTLQTLEPLNRSGEVSREIGTGSDAGRVLQAAGWPAGERALVVGHQPTLGQVIARLVSPAAIASASGELEDDGVSVRKGAVWWFATRERDGRVETVLKAVMNPEMLD